MQSRTIEIAVGVFVALGLAAVFMLAMRVSNLSQFTGEGGYPLTIRFDNIGGLKLRAPVALAGVTIGRVTDIKLSGDTYQAVVTLKINDPSVRLPTDTSASIYTAGLLGENYISLEPGGAETFLKPGGEIKLTQSALVLEQMIGQFLFSRAEGEKK
jgi:phospholipid/cholesterol/gamma-HCH transport system substrate-binding protein